MPSPPPDLMLFCRAAAAHQPCDRFICTTVSSAQLLPAHCDGRDSPGYIAVRCPTTPTPSTIAMQARHAKRLLSPLHFSEASACVHALPRVHALPPAAASHRTPLDTAPRARSQARASACTQPVEAARKCFGARCTAAGPRATTAGELAASLLSPNAAPNLPCYCAAN